MSALCWMLVNHPAQMGYLPAPALISCCNRLNILLLAAYFQRVKAYPLNVFEDAGKGIHINMYFIPFI